MLQVSRDLGRASVAGPLGPCLALDPLGIQPGTLGPDQVLGFAQAGEDFPDAGRVRHACRPALPLNPAPGASHERDSRAFGQVV
jgi:hypothetical protein